MKDKIQKLREQFQDELGTVNASSSLEELRRNFLSKKGYVSGLMKELGKVPPEQKKTTGQLINTFKQEVIAKFEEKEKELIHLEESVFMAGIDCFISETSSREYGTNRTSFFF